MDWHAEARRALAAHAPAAALDPGVVEELAQHAEAAREAADAAVAAGAETAAAADARVREWLAGQCAELAGSGAAFRPRRPRPQAVPPPPAGSRGTLGLALDLRYALRQLRRYPGFALGAGGTLALGVAAATTLLSIAYGVLARPLPWAGSDRLVRLTETREGSTRLLPPLLTNGTYRAWAERHESLAAIAAVSREIRTLERPGAAPERVRTVAATASLFPLLGLRPELGRFFTAADEAPGGAAVAVLTHEGWQRRFGGDPAVIGKVLRLDGSPYTVVGVAPPRTSFPRPEVELYLPLHVPPATVDAAGGQTVALLEAVGRLAPGATPAQATAEGTARGRGAPPLGLVGTAVFGSAGEPVVAAQPLVAAWTADVRPALLLLLAAAALLLASAIANVAGMQLARALARRREVAVRAAVGAGAGRIARQLLVENALLGAAAGAVALLLSWGLHRLLPALMPRDFPRLHEVALDLRVAAAGMAIAVLAGLALGLFPVLLVRRLELAGTLVAEGPLQLGGRFRLSVGRARGAIMTAQVAAALVLLAGAGLLGRSLQAHWQADRGYRPANLLTAQLPMTGDAFDPSRRAAVLDGVLERLAGLPGVELAAATSVLPLTAAEMLTGFTLRDAEGNEVQAQAATRIVSPGYFETLGMRLLEGRPLAATDGRDGLPALVVNRAFVATYGRGLGDTLPGGAAMRAGGDEWTIVGVVEDVRQQAATDAPRPEVFASYRQLPGGFEPPVPTVVVRTGGDPARLAGLLRAVVAEVAPGVPVDSVMTMEERLAASLAGPRLYAVLLGAFAALAILVTGVGLFGVLSYTVAQRWRELGVRAALGAAPGDVARLVVRQALQVTAAGLALGFVVLLALRRSLAHLLFGVTAGDPATWALAAALLVAVALLACLQPARRAARVDPVQALGA